MMTPRIRRGKRTKEDKKFENFTNIVLSGDLDTDSHRLSRATGVDQITARDYLIELSYYEWYQRNKSMMGTEI